MKKALWLAAFVLLPTVCQAKMPHSQIITPGLQARLAEFYGGNVMPEVALPRDDALTICFGGGCAGQVRLVLDQAMADELALVFLSWLDADTAEAERIAAGYATDYFYDAVKSRLRPTTADPSQVDQSKSEHWINANLQTSEWECKTHAQNVTAVMYQLQRLGLLKHNRLGPVLYRSGHYFGTVYDERGALWQMDSYFGDTAFSAGANCRHDTPICIQRVR